MIENRVLQTGLTMLFLLSILGCPLPASPECPFPLLSYKEVKMTEDELIVQFASEIKGEIELLKKNISQLNGQVKTNPRIQSTVKRYAARGLAGDSIFVGYYNSYVSNACNWWFLYKDHSSNKNEASLQEALLKIETFIDDYSQRARRNQLAELKELRDRLIAFPELIKKSTKLDQISKRNYLRKIAHLESRLSGVNGVALGNGDIRTIGKVRSMLESLIHDFEKGKNF